MAIKSVVADYSSLIACVLTHIIIIGSIGAARKKGKEAIFNSLGSPFGNPRSIIALFFAQSLLNIPYGNGKGL
jgi:hypothetical protein